MRLIEIPVKTLEDELEKWTNASQTDFVKGKIAVLQWLIAKADAHVKPEQKIDPCAALNVYP